MSDRVKLIDSNYIRSLILLKYHVISTQLNVRLKKLVSASGTTMTTQSSSVSLDNGPKPFTLNHRTAISYLLFSRYVRIYNKLPTRSQSPRMKKMKL